MMNPLKSGELLTALRGILSPDRVTSALSSLEQFSHDESHHRVGNVQAVAHVKTIEEVSELMKFCNKHKIPAIPFGTGTGIEGGVTAPFGGVSINMAGLDKILAVNRDDFDCTVQAGITRKQLNAHLRDTGLWFPVDPGADASLCGMCATGASGTNAVRYGTMRENVLNLQIVLPNGEIIHTKGEGRRARKSSAGYNLTGLFVGSEGTLGVITSATLKLYGQPEQISSAVVSFKSVKNAIQAAVQIMQSCIPIARIEFLDDKTIEAANKYSKLSLKPLSTLFLEFHGSSMEIEAQSRLAGEICRDCSENGESDFQWSADQQERDRLWKARHDAYYAALALRPNSRGYITDVCVPISELPTILTESKRDIVECGLIGGLIGHVGDGNFHTLLLVQNEEEIKLAEKISDKIVKRALAVGGTCTGEHGVGLGKKKYLKEELGEECVNLMKQLKTTIDPNNIMNPGKIL